MKTCTSLYSLSTSDRPLMLKVTSPSFVTGNAFFARTLYHNFSYLSYCNPTPRVADNYNLLSEVSIERRKHSHFKKNEKNENRVTVTNISI